jgi:hypothetical protein
MSDARLPNESWQAFAERRIREAQEQGFFDRIEGFGRPIPGIDQPLEENWWLKRKLKEETSRCLLAIPAQVWSNTGGIP